MKLAYLFSQRIRIFYYSIKSNKLMERLTKLILSIDIEHENYEKIILYLKVAFEMVDGDNEILTLSQDVYPSSHGCICKILEYIKFDPYL